MRQMKFLEQRAMGLNFNFDVSRTFSGIYNFCWAVDMMVYWDATED